MLQKMAGVEIRDEFGNPIPITDEFGNPVKLTDEHGNPIHLTGVVTAAPTTPTTASGTVTTALDNPTPASGFGTSGTATNPTAGSGFGTYGTGAYGGGASATTQTKTTVADLISTEPARQHVRHTDQASGRGLHRSTSSSSSSSSSSSEDDGEGGRRKKKGVKDKIKEKLPGGGGRNKDEHNSETSNTVPAEPARQHVRHTDQAAGDLNPHPTATVTATHHPAEASHNEKKGILEKIKDKLPGHHNH